MHTFYLYSFILQLIEIYIFQLLTIVESAAMTKVCCVYYPSIVIYLTAGTDFECVYVYVCVSLSVSLCVLPIFIRYPFQIFFQFFGWYNNIFHLRYNWCTSLFKTHYIYISDLAQTYSNPAISAYLMLHLLA